MPDCFLHVGTHKTGSSAIQAFLLQKRETLLGRGLLVPDAGLHPNGNYLSVFRALCNRPTPERHGDLIGRLEDEMSRVSHDALLLSSESLENHFRAHVPSEVVAFFRARGYSVKLICFVRPQHERINSSYAQVVKAFRRNISVQENVSRTLAASLLFYSRWLRIAEAHGVDLVALPYSRATQRDGVVTAFLRVIGLEDLAPPSDAYRVNVTIGAAAVAAARTCMDRLEARGLRLTQRQHTRCLSALKRTNAAFPSPPFWGISASLTRRIQEHYRGDNEYFASKAWNAEWDEVLGKTEHYPRRNEVARDDETHAGHAAYVAVLERLWPAVLRIAENPELSEPRSWERNPASGP